MPSKVTDAVLRLPAQSPPTAYDLFDAYSREAQVGLEKVNEALQKLKYGRLQEIQASHVLSTRASESEDKFLVPTLVSLADDNPSPHWQASQPQTMHQSYQRMCRRIEELELDMVQVVMANSPQSDDITTCEKMANDLGNFFIHLLVQVEQQLELHAPEALITDASSLQTPASNRPRSCPEAWDVHDGISKLEEYGFPM